MDVSRRKFVRLLGVGLCAGVLCRLRMPSASAEAEILTSHTFAGPDGESMNYLLYTPQNASAGMPLLVYLHGGSGKGSDLSLLTSTDGLPQYFAQGRLAPAAYAVFPQLSEEHKGWAECADTLLSLISDLEKRYGIDPDAVSLTGHSMGGTGVWQTALNSPCTFAAIAPLSGSVQLSRDNLKMLSSLPVWAVVGSDDTIVPPEESIRFVQALSTVNAEARITVLEGADHFDVPAFYLDTDAALIEWLVTQRRKD